eukprot:14608171-Ditylum_brightwellii.AAC.1
MYGCIGKWTVGFADGLVETLRANAFCLYRAFHRDNKMIRRQGQHKFLAHALEVGLQWAFDSLKHKRKMQDSHQDAE